MTLSERVERLTGADRGIDGLIFKAMFPERDWHEFENGWASRCPIDNVAFDTAPAYTAIIDAAMTLVPEGCLWTVGSEPWDAPRARCYLVEGLMNMPDGYGDLVSAATPALALCAAALRARGL